MKPRKWNDFRIDIFGQDGPQWVSCFAFDETDYLVSFQPEGCCMMYGPYWPRFGAYWQTADGARELLAYDWKQCVGRVVPVMARTKPVQRVDFDHPEVTAKAGIEAFRHFLKTIGMPGNFAELGADEKDIPELVDILCNGNGRPGYTGGFVKLYEKDCAEIYRLMV